MDSYQVALTSITVLIVILIIIAFVCHYLGPRANAWFRSNREEKIGLSKSKIFNANGYMIHSGSDFLHLSSTGSFKRFDSIDRDYKQVGQSSLTPAPTWNISQTDTIIPPQPLRPAPAPTLLIKSNGTKLSESSNPIYETENVFNRKDEKIHVEGTHHSQIIEMPIKQKSLETEKLPSSINMAIPRPTTKRQLSNPIPKIGNGYINFNGIKNENVSGSMTNHNQRKENNENPLRINFNETINNIERNSTTTALPSTTSLISGIFTSTSAMALPSVQQEQRQHKRTISTSSCTNPFLNGIFDTLSENFDNSMKKFTSSIHINNNNSSIDCDITKENTNFDSNKGNERINNYKNEIHYNKNPFTADYIRVVQQQYGKENHNENFPQYSSSNSSESYTFDLLPEMKEPPKTDLGRYSIFDFEPDRITSILDQTPTTSIRNEYSLLSNNDQTLNNQNSINQIDSLSNIDDKLVSSDGSHTNDNNSGDENNIISSPQKKYLDSPCSDVFDDIESMLKKHFRNRSYSETEATENDLQIFKRNRSNSKSLNTNPFLEKTSQMHKTFSENFLTKSGTNINSNQIWCFGGGRSLSRQDSFNMILGRRNSSQSSLNDSCSSIDSINLQRALSCESVSSQSSVVLADLEPMVPPVTGQLCVGLQYDKNTITDDGIELVVTVMEAKELIGPSNLENFDTFVRIYLVPDETGAMQTKLFKNTSSPSYNETFCFWLNKNRGRRSLWFHLYHSGTTHTLIGEAEMQISDVTATRPLTIWLPLSDSRQNNAQWGELMFSLSYLPTAERLTVVVVKGRNLKLDNKNNREILVDTQNIFVKVYLLKDDKKVSKKKTSLKRKDRCPIFNESMIFSIPPYLLNSIQVRLTVVSESDTEILPIGHIIVGNNTNGKGIQHWKQMLSSLRKPVAMWHPLRKTGKITDVT